MLSRHPGAIVFACDHLHVEDSWSFPSRAEGLSGGRASSWFRKQMEGNPGGTPKWIVYNGKIWNIRKSAGWFGGYPHIWTHTDPSLDWFWGILFAGFAPIGWEKTHGFPAHFSCLRQHRFRGLNCWTCFFFVHQMASFLNIWTSPTNPQNIPQHKLNQQKASREM